MIGDDVTGGRPNRPWIRLVGLLVGLGLVSGAVVFILRQRHTVDEALSALARPDPLDVGLLVASVIGNLVLTAFLLRLLLSRFGRVGAGEMICLIASAGLLNHLPMRPGLVGRVAYHKRFNGIGVRDSVRVMFEAVGLGGVCMVWAIICLLAGRASETVFGGMVLGPVPVLLIGAALFPNVRIWLLAGLLRYMDLLLTALRYFVTFRLLDHAVGYDTAMLLAGVSLGATLIPFLSNGLGVREWAVAWLAPVLESAVSLTGAVALTADLVNRAAELVVTVPAGLIGSAWVARRMRSSGAGVPARERPITLAPSMVRVDLRSQIRPHGELNESQRDVETDLTERVVATESADAAYSALPESHGGKVVCADTARLLSPSYQTRAGRLTHSLSTSRPAAAYADDLFARRIQAPPAHSSGLRPLLVTTAGGAAAGKSSSLSAELVAVADLVLDTQFRTEQPALKKIDLALANRWEVRINYTHRPFKDAVHAAIERTQALGRWARLDNLPGGHVSAQRTIVALADHYADNPYVRVDAWMNTGIAPTRFSLDRLREGGDLYYNGFGQLQEILREELSKAQRSRQYDDALAVLAPNPGAEG